MKYIIILCAPLLFSLPSLAHKEEAVVKEVQREKILYPPEVRYHPPAVHFAVSLPIILLVLEAFYILRGKRPDSLEFLFVFLTSSAVTGGALTGYVAHESMEDIPIQAKALELLHTHETLGIYLAVLFWLVFALRLLYTFKPSLILRLFYLILMLAGAGGVLFQGSLGGKLVYDFGLGVSG